MAPFEAIKEEVAGGVSQLSARTYFGLVSFSNVEDPQIWSTKPKRGTSANKSAALGWVGTIQAMSHGSCVIGGALETLKIAQKARRTQGRNKQMILLYNEAPSCGGYGVGGNASYTNEAIETITGANRERLKISTIYIPEFGPQSLAISFGQDLAAANNGRYEQHEPAY